MNPYSTELRRAMTLADQILALKQNRSLSEADAIQVDLLRQQHRQCGIVPVAFARVRDQAAGVLVQRRLPLFGAVPGHLCR